jgi:hypothetical protein
MILRHPFTHKHKARNDMIPKLYKASRLIDGEPRSVVGGLEPGDCVEHVGSRISF